MGEDPYAGAQRLMNQLNLCHRPSVADVVEPVMKWIEDDQVKGRVDCKSFVKHTPSVVVQRLKDGSYTPELITEIVVDRYIVACYQNGGRGIRPLKPMVSSLADSVAERVFFNYGNNDNIAKETKEKFAIEFSDHLLKRTEEYLVRDDIKAIETPCRCGKSGCAPAKDKVLAVMQKAFVDTAAALAGRFDDDIFGGAKGAYLQRCPLLMGRRDDDDDMSFRGAFMEAKSGIRGRITSQLMLAATGVAEGWHETAKKCWECNASSERGAVVISCCARCCVAGYCSKSCQVSAWKAHKGKCKELKVKYGRLTDAINTVESYHHDDTYGGSSSSSSSIGSRSLYGLRLNCEIEYAVVESMFSSPVHSFKGILPGPNMETYYENLGRVARGEWWIFPDEADTSSCGGCCCDCGECERRFHEELTHLLAYDYFGYVAAQHDGGVPDDPSFITGQIFGEFELQFNDLRNSFGCVSTMSATRFLELYEKRRGGQNESRASRARLRRQFRAKMLTKLHEEFH